MRFLLLIFILGGCASAYHPIRPDASYYGNKSTESNVDFSYKLGVLREHGNKKYAKREDRKGIRLASVKIVNNTTIPLEVGEDIEFYSGDSRLIPIDPITLHHELKQGVPIYLLYLLMSVITVNRYDERGNVTSAVPVGLFIGPGIAVGNMAAAGAANQNFLEEMEKFNVVGKTLKPGETAYGIIGVRDIGYNPIQIRVTPRQITAN